MLINFFYSQCELVLKFLKDYEINSYDHEIVNEEREEIDVVYTNKYVFKDSLLLSFSLLTEFN